MRRKQFRQTLQQRKVPMKKSILIATLALLSLPFFSAQAQNYDRREERPNYRRSSEYRQLRAEIDQLNRMFAHINAYVYTYGSGRQVRRDYSRLRRDMDRLNYELQRPTYDRLRLHSQIDRLRDQLREIEVRLRVSRTYRWR
jgi:hypothetical protein